MSRKQDLYDDELDGLYEDDEDLAPLWQKLDETLENGEEVVVTTPPDKNVLRAEKHRKKLLRQMKERETDARRYE